MSQGQLEQLRRQERFYLLVGAGGLAVLLLAFLLRGGSLSFFGRLLHLVGGVVVAVWAVAGMMGSRRQRLELEEAVAAREQVERTRVEAQEAARRVVAEVNAHRTTSHGGMTIELHKVRSNRDENA